MYVDTINIPFIGVSFQIYVCTTPTSTLQFWACRRPRKGLWFAMSKGDNSYKQVNEVEAFIIPAMHPVLFFGGFSLFVSRLTTDS